MSRNNRAIKDWQEEAVANSVVAPHRYTWDRDAKEDDFATHRSGRISEWKAALPYQPNDVIWVARNGVPVRARILYVVVDYDRFGDRRPIFQCQTETAKGIWSKVWTRHHPGDVQRGYLLAGMAPDLVGKLD